MREQGFRSLAFSAVILISASVAGAQSLGSAGTVEVEVLDPSGAVIRNADVTIANAITGYQQTATMDAAGHFRLTNIPPNSYRLRVGAPGFQAFTQDLTVRNAVPITLNAPLQLAGSQTTVNVESGGAVQLEDVPYAHSDLDRKTYDKLPTTSPGAGLSDAITYGAPGVVADANGFFHPIGDHAETTFSIDGQPISDQQSKLFSTQVPLNAIQSMELVTGTPNAEYGGKTSLVVETVTRSGLGLKKPTGSLLSRYGSFGEVGGEATLGIGGPKLGNFLSANGLRSGRFLDTPEFRPFHARGNNATIFNRFDYQASEHDVFHLNLFLARNWFQTPNTFDQQFSGQDQRQKVRTFNIAPGYQRTIAASTLFTLNAFLRQDAVNYYPSRDPFADTPATVAEARRLRNLGFKSDISYVHGMHSIKAGVEFVNTGLSEDFHLALTDSAFNPVCLNSAGGPVSTPTLTNPSQCSVLGYAPNPSLQPGLVALDLTRNGSPLTFRGRKDINQSGVFVQDSVTIRGFVINAGFRVDHYAGIVTDTGLEPRVAASYQMKATGTVLRAGYGRLFETPYNENLILSSVTGAGGLAQNTFGAQAATPITPARRNQYNAGIQQKFGKVLLVDADYSWKYTDRAFDFDTLFNTAIVFPIQWAKSKIDGVSMRLSTPTLHGFTAFTTLGHVRARYFGPETGGIIFNSPVNQSVFRIDHDQAFQQTTNIRYQAGTNGPWASLTWRYDSGLAAGAITSFDDALSLTAAQQSALGLFCGAQRATLSSPITTCNSPVRGAIRLNIPAPGTYNADRNPTRVTPRNLFNIGVGTDNLLRRSEGPRLILRFTLTNLTNVASLYNFLSTFSGTHWTEPRAYRGEVGVVF